MKSPAPAPAASSGPVPADAPLVLLVQEDSGPPETTEGVLREAGYRVRRCGDVARVRAELGRLDEPLPAAVLLVPGAPEHQTEALRVLAGLGLGGKGGIPLLLLSPHDDLALRLAAHRGGVTSYLLRPAAPALLLAQLDQLTGRQAATSYRVLLVDDDELMLDYLGSVLREAGMQVRALADPLRLFDACDAFDPEVVVLDFHMPHASGLELAAILRQRTEQRGRDLPVLFLSADDEPAPREQALRAGGDDFLAKPVDAARLVAAVTARARRARMNNELHHHLELSLYEQERQQLALNQHAIVSATDARGQITYVNDKFCEISGYSRAELLGQNHRVVKSSEHSGDFYERMWQSISAGQVWQGEICNRRKDGALYWVESTIVPFLDASGLPYQYVSIRTDISRVKAAEAVARASEARLDYILKASPVVLYTCKAAPGFPPTYVSQNVRELFGFAPDGCLREPGFWQSRLHPEDAPRVFAGLEGVLERGAHTHEYRFRLQDGSYRWIHDALRVTYDSQGQPLELVGYWADIDARVRAEQVAEAMKERLRRGQLYANIGTWDWNIQTGELHWTERIAPLFGYPAGDLDTSYENFLKAVHPDDRQAVVDAVTACVERDAPYEIEHRVVWPDGTVRWLLERGAVVRDAAGKPLQMLGVVQDVDDRKRTQMALAEREQELLQAQSLARIGNWTADMRSGELHWSDEIYRIFGHAPGAITPSVQAFMDAVHPEDRELVRASEERAERTGRHDVVHRIVRPDGTIRHVHELAAAEKDGAGRLVRLSGTVQDVTEQVQAEIRLRETEARFSFAVEGAGDGIWDWNIATGEMSLSGSYEPMLGYAKGELEPTLDAWVKSVHPDDLPRVQELLAEYLDGRVAVYAPELRLHCKDGSYKWILCRGTVVERDPAGKPLRMIGIHSDISERKRAEAALMEAREAAERANRAKSDFLSSMSHELRTPMNAILGFGQLLEYDTALSSDNRDNVHEILKAGRHLLDLINEVLDLAKVESGHVDLSLEPVELKPVVDECLSLLLTQAGRLGVTLRDECQDVVVVRADRMRLKQVLLNLLSNAVKYNRQGGAVCLEARRAGADRWRIEVVDTGPGIAPQRLHELFQPFNRLGAEGGEIEGTGIGLTITRRLVELMGGEMGVTSELGVGSRFWLELPFEAVDEPQTGMPSRSGGEPSAGMARPLDGSQACTVLYIEDNPANIKLVAQILGHLPHIRLLTAHTPELGIELATSHQPDLILLDINLPQMDGYRVLQVLRSHKELDKTPVVAITANAMPGDIERGKAAGFDDYLVKPLNVANFTATMERLLPKGLHA